MKLDLLTSLYVFVLAGPRAGAAPSSSSNPRQSSAGIGRAFVFSGGGNRVRRSAIPLPCLPLSSKQIQAK